MRVTLWDCIFINFIPRFIFSVHDWDYDTNLKWKAHISETVVTNRLKWKKCVKKGNLLTVLGKNVLLRCIPCFSVNFDLLFKKFHGKILTKFVFDRLQRAWIFVRFTFSIFFPQYFGLLNHSKNSQILHQSERSILTHYLFHNPKGLM